MALINSDMINIIINNIGPKYFDDDFSLITKNRIGLFGVVTETMGNIFESSVLTNAIKTKEKLSITASRETLLQEAAGYPELVIPQATPASIMVNIGVPEKYLYDNFMSSANTINFVLHKDTIVSVSNISYLLPYSVNIIGRKNDDQFLYSSQYIIDDENPTVNISNPYLVTQIRYIDGVKYIFFNTYVYQLQKQYSYYNITETEIIPLQGITFDYTDQLVYFNVLYRDSALEDYKLVTKMNYLARAALTGDGIYYNDTEPGSIRLYIPQTFNFNFNGELRLDIYTTTGTKGNFTYTTGEILVLPNSYENEIDYTGSYFKNYVITDSTGGTDSPTTDEIRMAVIKYKSTLRSIDTENDLAQFFQDADPSNNMVFIKKRIDVFEKKYTAFMILRDLNRGVISTNSLDATLYPRDIDAYYPQTARRMIFPSSGYSLIPGQDFQVTRNADIFYKVTRLRLRMSGSTQTPNAQIRELNIMNLFTERLLDTDFTVTDGANSDGPVDITSFSNALDIYQPTYWDMGPTTVQDADHYKEAILTLNTPVALANYILAVNYDTLQNFFSGSLEVQYEHNAGTNPDGSDGTWVSLIAPRAFTVTATEDVSGNTVSGDISRITDDSKIAELEDDTGSFLWGCPYLMVLNEDPTSTSFYLNSISKENIVNLSYANQNAPLQFIVNKFQITRNAVMGESSYKLTFNLIPASELPSGIVDTDTGQILQPDVFKVYGYAYTGTDTSKTVDGYYPMTITGYDKTDSFFTVETYLKTDDYITVNDELRLVDTIYSKGTTDFMSFITPINEVRIGIGIYYKDGAFTDKSDYDNIIPGLDEYGLLNVYANDNDKSTLMINMTRLIQSVLNISPDPSPNGTLKFDLTQIPLVRYSELRNNIDRISQIITKTNAALSQLLLQIRNNSSIDYKFYATYGHSRYFSMESTNIPLDRLDITMRFKVRVLANRSDATLINDLKTFIRPLIEDINVNAFVNSSIYFSNVITQVENEFKYDQGRILAFELSKVNEYPVLYQSLINMTPVLDQMTKTELLEHVPEFVKMDINKIIIEIIPV